MTHQPIYPLQGVIQYYAWGGFDFIPRLLGIDNAGREPHAELWMGAHPGGMSSIQTGEQWMPLGEFIDREPGKILGSRVAGQYHNRLPFLFKVLDVRKMLSIQAHPTKKAAEEGFRRENEAGIPLNAPHRLYKDDNHKPEVMVALTDFRLLHGFRPARDIGRTLKETPELAELVSVFAGHDIRRLYQTVMELRQEEVNRMLEPMRRRLQPAFESGKLSKDHPDYWVALAFEDYTEDGRYDRGVFSVYLLNLVRLRPGEGIFQDAGVPHAYLEGVNMELMANSDNVFRGGLTPKHIDTEELLRHLVFESVTPEILAGETVSATEQVYRTPAPDFELSRIRIRKGQRYSCLESDSPAIFIVMEGTATVDWNGREQVFRKGESFFSPYGAGFWMESGEGGVLFRAGVGGVRSSVR
jgi:mannose-6-phosphate isomerase